jgi:hypothetical protein
VPIYFLATGSTGARKITRSPGPELHANKRFKAAKQDADLHYRMAPALATTSVVTGIIEQTRMFYRVWRWYDDVEPRDFLALVAPTGSGKTQMAFSLMSTQVLDVVHVNLANAGKDLSQRMGYVDYTAPESISLYQAVNADLERFCSGSRLSLLREDGHRPSDIVACLRHLFDIPPSVAAGSTESQIAVNSVRAFRADVRARTVKRFDGGDERFPLLVADDASDEPHSNLLRNMLCAVGLATLVMGTSLHGCGLVLDPSGMGRIAQNFVTRKWATFRPELPPARLADMELLTLAQLAHQFTVLVMPTPTLGTTGGSDAAPLTEQQRAEHWATVHRALNPPQVLPAVSNGSLCIGDHPERRSKCAPVRLLSN